MSRVCPSKKKKEKKKRGGGEVYLDSNDFGLLVLV